MTVRDQIRTYYKGEGLSDAAISAITAQAEKESSLRPSLCEKSRIGRTGMTQEQYISCVDSGSYEWDNDRIGFGLFQWTYHSRKHDLLALAQKRKRSVSDTKVQLEYAGIEFKQRQYKLSEATKKLVELVTPGMEVSTVWDLMQKAPDTELGAFVIGFSLCMDFEKPERKITSSPSRGARAAEIYRELKKT